MTDRELKDHVQREVTKNKKHELLRRDNPNLPENVRDAMARSPGVLAVPEYAERMQDMAARCVAEIPGLLRKPVGYGCIERLSRFLHDEAYMRTDDARRLVGWYVYVLTEYEILTTEEADRVHRL